MTDGPWTKYQQSAPADGPWTKYGAASQPAPQEVTPTQNPNYFAGPLRAVAQGATFGYGDEAEAKLTGVPLAQIQADMGQFSKDYPAAAVSGEVGGGILSAILGGAAVSGATKAVPALGRAVQAIDIPNRIKTVAGAAAGGAAYGSGTAQEGERLSGAGKGAGIGAGVAVGGMGAAAILGPAYNKILKPVLRKVMATPKRDAHRLLQMELDRMGITQDQAIQAMRENGDEAMLLDLKPYLTDLAYEVQAGAGPGRGIINSALDTRQAGQQSRILKSAGQELGAYADDAKAFVETIGRAKAEQAGPLYKSAHQQNIRTTPEFENLLQRVPSSAFDEARKIAAARGVSLDDLADVEKLDYVKRGLDTLVKRGFSGQSESVSPALAREYAALRNEMLDFVDTQVPDFKKARGIWAGASALEDAVTYGKDIFKEAPDELADIVKRYGDSERQAFRYGVSQAIQDKVERAKETGNAVSRIAGTPRLKKILRAAFDSDAEYKQFMRQLQHEEEWGSSRAAIQGNSLTHARQMRTAERRGDIPDPSQSGVMSWLARQFSGDDPIRNPETNRILAELLTSRAPPMPGQAIPYAPANAFSQGQLPQLPQNRLPRLP